MPCLEGIKNKKATRKGGFFLPATSGFKAERCFTIQDKN